MSDIKLSECLFVDLKTDEQRRDWFSMGRGVVTGIIAPALQPALVIAYSKIVESGKLIEQQQQRITELEQLYSEAIKLLEAAVCPCCDKSGAYYDNNGEVCQCQWCDEVNRLPQPQKGEKQ